MPSQIRVTVHQKCKQIPLDQSHKSTPNLNSPHHKILCKTHEETSAQTPSTATRNPQVKPGKKFYFEIRVS